ncbi:M23 family metallopeptidase [Sphingomonas sp. QA11]|uniref:M23 family metallopeptidase n=1 Tax=Sphingomonas sp. QA11 TaxID=2950605 RepID=UPI00234ACE06|nr:M23 family metallopeptidase [Sphingomonas sp. QA11]WCM27206.1 M23 family metallopeptidase [Sphingomonas sp. QA11]
MRHPKGGYMAMALMSRTMDDLDEVTKGERAATYEEVDKYFGHALIAEGLVPFTYTADQAIWWWKSGGYKVLGGGSVDAQTMPSDTTSAHSPDQDLGANLHDEEEPTGVPHPSPAPLLRGGPGESFTTNASALDETWEAQRDALMRSSAYINAKGMVIDDGVDPQGKAETTRKAPAGEPSQAATSPTKPADMFRDIQGWGAPKLAPVKVPPQPVSVPTPRQTPAKPATVAGARPGVLKRGWPVPGGGYTAQKGKRDSRGKAYSDGSYDLTGQKRGGRKHKGYDLPGEIGALVSAAADGVVAEPPRTEYEKIWTRDETGAIKRDKNGQKLFTHGKKVVGWGNYVIIQHPDGYRTVYAHLREVPRLKKNDPVRMGQEIGRLGVTGNAATKGSHVHFEVRNGTMAKTYDPGDWLAGRLPALRR